MLSVTINGFSNPNEYDEGGYLAAFNELVVAAGGMVAAGAQADDIAQAVKNGIESAN